MVMVLMLWLKIYVHAEGSFVLGLGFIHILNFSTLA